ncbi:MAG: DM13 domain-containing protein [Chitinophagaceae bacterium]
MKTIIVLLSFAVVISSCKKSALDTANETLPTGTVISSGNFVSNSHTTSGTAKVVTDAAGKKYLVIENLRTDNGPDLRIWLSPNNNASSYQEVGLLRAVTGNFSYELSPAINYTTNNRVLIWCEDFSVLFGHAILQ